MAKSVRTGSTRNRMSSVVAGDTSSRVYGGATPKGRSSVSATSPYRSAGLGMPVTGMGANIKSRKAITDRIMPAGAMVDIRGYLGDERTGIRKSVPGTRAPAVAPVVAKAPVKKTPTVVSNVVRERPSPTPAKAAAPARKAVSARTGDTTGVTTGKTTGTTARVGGVATKTKQTAYGRQMASAARRGNQPAGPMGGGGRSGAGGGSSRPSGGGSLGGARGRIGEPGGSKR